MPEKIVVEGTIASRVTERLREDIISKRVEAGSRITIKEISERYGTSNMPVREAFRTLEGEKLLEINAYKGATVLCIDEDFVRDVYGLLRALECLIYETALPKIDEVVLQELRSINVQIHACAASLGNKTEYIDLNSKFHDTIMACGKNDKALDLYRYYHKLIRTLRSSYFPRAERIRAVAAQHDNLIDALASKDVLAVKKAVDIHVITAMENFLDQYAQEL